MNGAELIVFHTLNVSGKFSYDKTSSISPRRGDTTLDICLTFARLVKMSDPKSITQVSLSPLPICEQFRCGERQVANIQVAVQVAMLVSVATLVQIVVDPMHQVSQKSQNV